MYLYGEYKGRVLCRNSSNGSGPIHSLRENKSMSYKEKITETGIHLYRKYK
jgi:hypothetical protein